MIYQIQNYHLGSHMIIGARTMLMDRIAPELEMLEMSPKVVKGGDLTFARSNHAPATSTGIKSALKRVLRNDHARRSDVQAVDFRNLAPSNWAHSLLYLLPLCQLLPRPLVAILNMKCPGHIVYAFELFGVSCIRTDQRVDGDIFTPKPSSEEFLNAGRRALIDQMPKPWGNSTRLPKRVFASRKDCRRLTNEAEIDELLCSRGFVKVYPEELTVIEQFQLFTGAEAVVGVHGAGLAPIGYAESPPTLIELLSPGHMTDFYRVIIDQMSGNYVGVRGKISKRNASSAYKLDQFYLKDSNDDFEVDPASVLKALSAARIRHD